MFAILVTPENMPKIAERDAPPSYMTACAMVQHKPKRWYLVTGFVMESTGALIDWTLLPAYIIEQYYQHDPNVIKTDWDQIVRN